ncbi:MAG TPA: hypothetical protein ENH50_11375 [Nitrospirae bacterium]|nr:hypothetical protein [Nitrospirota bacterium]HDY72252.1 hypothetical protein [Nitrospirota bacterium]
MKNKSQGEGINTHQAIMDNALRGSGKSTIADASERGILMGLPGFPLSIPGHCEYLIPLKSFPT